MVERTPAHCGHAPLGSVPNTDNDGGVEPSFVLPTTRVAPVVLLILTACAAFVPVLTAGFVSWDDSLNVTGNPYLNPVTTAHLFHLWRHPYQQLYIPLSYTVYDMIMLAADGPRPMPFHAASLALHLVNTGLVYAIVRRLVSPSPVTEAGGSRLSPLDVLKNSLPAFAGALVFAIHPIVVETVAWVSELRGVLSECLSLIAILKFMHYLDSRRGAANIAIATVAMAAALLAKPGAAVTPLIAFVIARWYASSRAGVRDVRVRQASLAPLVLWVALGALLAGVTAAVQPIPVYVRISLWPRVSIAGDAIAFYIGKLIAPVHLGIVYGHNPSAVLASPFGKIAWIVPFASIFVVYALRTRVPQAAAAITIFLLGLLPNLGFLLFVFQQKSTTADRYVYPAMLGVALFVAWAMRELQERMPAPGRLMAGFAIVLGIGAMMWLRSTEQARVWQNDVALFTNAIAVDPKSAECHNNLGLAYLQLGETDRGRSCFKVALTLSPRFPLPYVGLGRVEENSGHWTQALALYSAAIRLDPKLPVARTFQALTMEHFGRYTEATQSWRIAVDGNPDSAYARYRYGLCLRRCGHEAEAQAQFHAALAIEPEYSDPAKALAAGS